MRVFPFLCVALSRVYVPQCCINVYVPRKRTGAAVASVQRLWIASLHETPPHVEQLSNLLPGQGFITVLVQLVEECV